MKRLYLAFALLVGISFSQQITMKRPPKSLEKYYPPQSQRMEYLSNMHTMSVAFHGINLNINEGRWDKALEWANQLKKPMKNPQGWCQSGGTISSQHWRTIL